MKHIGFMLSLCLLATTTVAAEPGFDRIDAKVAMSDGVELDASLYLPENSVGRLPIIVRHHGGGSNKDSSFDVNYGLKAVATGRFALLMYSHRGHGDSGGVFDFFGPRTTLDFSEMLDWVAANYGERIDTDNVGSAGYSQGGGESLLPAAHDARVKALAVGNTFADFNYALNPNDCYKLSFATGIFVGAYTSSFSIVDYTLAARWGSQLMSDTEDIPLVPYLSTTDDLASRSPQTYVQEFIDRRVPIFWTNSWEDQIFPADHPERMLTVLELAGVPIHYWFASGGHAAGASYPPEEQAREQAMLEWFEQFLLGVDHGFLSGPKVDYWQRVTGAPRKQGEWEHHQAATWPVPTATASTWYPRANGSLAVEPAAPGESAPLINDYVSFNVANDALVHEVAGQVPGMGDILDRIPESKNPLDTLTYTSEPITHPLNVVGAPELIVSQDSTRLLVQQIDAKIWDSGPDGMQLIWRGCVSGALGREVRFKLWPNAHRFEPGHQMVLSISSVDLPVFKPDVEPWRANILLEGTRIELPTTSAEKAAKPTSKRTRFGGALSPCWPLLLLWFCRRRQ